MKLRARHGGGGNEPGSVACKYTYELAIRHHRPPQLYLFLLGVVPKFRRYGQSAIKCFKTGLYGAMTIKRQEWSNGASFPGLYTLRVGQLSIPISAREVIYPGREEKKVMVFHVFCNRLEIMGRRKHFMR